MGLKHFGPFQTFNNVPMTASIDSHWTNALDMDNMTLQVDWIGNAGGTGVVTAYVSATSGSTWAALTLNQVPILTGSGATTASILIDLPLLVVPMVKFNYTPSVPATGTLNAYLCQTIIGSK